MNKILSLAAALTFAILVTASVTFNYTPFWLLAAYIVMSLITFAFYALDKSASISGRWRTKESTLHLLSLAGGWPGALFAQQILRHKSSKRMFITVLWITVLLNIIGFAWLHSVDINSF